MDMNLENIDNEIFGADLTSVFEYDDMAAPCTTASEQVYAEDAENLYAAMF